MQSEQQLKTSFMKKVTRTDYEAELNGLYQSCMSADEAFNDLVYLTIRNPSRPKATTEARLKAAIQNGTAGTLLRRLDPIRFNVGFNDFII